MHASSADAPTGVTRLRRPDLQPRTTGPHRRRRGDNVTGVAFAVDVQALLNRGSHVVCQVCRGVVRGGSNCRFCHTPPTGPTGPTGPTRPTGPTGPKPVDGRASGDLVGGLAGLPSQTLWVVVFGDPVTQGSMRALAGGVVAHEKAQELKRWRRALTQEAARRCGPGWHVVQAAVQLEAVFTVRRPAGAPKARTFPAVKPDSDKLLRAAQDSLAPRSAVDGRVLADDSRIVDARAVKTYPSPAHTHPWALPKPGVVLRLTVAGGGVQPTPSGVLTDPGMPPHQLACYLSGYET